jgi:hypothetical protein
MKNYKSIANAVPEKKICLKKDSNSYNQPFTDSRKLFIDIDGKDCAFNSPFSRGSRVIILPAVFRVDRQ